MAIYDSGEPIEYHGCIIRHNRKPILTRAYDWDWVCNNPTVSGSIAEGTGDSIPECKEIIDALFGVKPHE